MSLSSCPHCGGSVRFVGRPQNTTNGHHNCVYECGECDRVVMSG